MGQLPFVVGCNKTQQQQGQHSMLAPLSTCTTTHVARDAP